MIPANARIRPRAEPVCDAHRVAARTLPLRIQRSERKTRPPSSGNAGMRLKTPSMTFVLPMNPTTPVTDGGALANTAAAYPAKKTSAKKQARRRPGQRHQQLGLGARRLIVHFR